MKKFNENIEQRLTARHKKCFKFCGDVSGKDIADIGSSFGWFEKMALVGKCKSVVGIEPKKKDFYQAKKEVPSATFKVGSALKMPFPNNSFDLVVIFDVIEHIPKNTEPRAIKEIFRILRPGGELVLSTPFDFWLSKIMDPAWYFGHRHYKEIQLARMLMDNGFKIERIEKRGRIFELISAILMYIFKWFFRREIPFKNWFETRKNLEYLTNKEGFETLYIKAVK